MDELRSLGYFSLSLKILIFKIIVVLCIPSLLTSVINLFLVLELFKNLALMVCDPNYAFFSCSNNTFALLYKSCCFFRVFTSCIFLVNSLILMVSFITRDSMSFFLISSCVNFLVFACAPFNSCKQKVTTILQI